ncbi:DUF5605 domain-containing protein [Streptomyces anulatus]|uniref:DUF5605 domain-containing protein n=1 Tax=Streptomyces anulatus TaxID=1892 RepID=UPI001C26C9F7|nr:DUF5605 domain-containing protein [Streptomyces anulatus]
MKFGPTARLGDVLDHPEGRRAVDTLLPGLSDHPSLEMIRSMPLGNLFDHVGDTVDKDSLAVFWKTLGAIERTVKHRGIGVASRPLPDYEADDVAQASAAATAPASASLWSTVEIAITGPSHGNPFTDVELTADFRLDSPGGVRAATAGGFYDGDGRWIVRFLPDAPGRWTFTTASNARSLDRITGSIEITDAVPGDHGPVRADGFHFAHADGTRHLPFGTTAYAWIHQPADVRAETLRTLAEAPFTKLRMCVFPKSYLHNTNEPDLYPFEGSPDDGFDFTRPNPAFFRHLEQSVTELGLLGIQADVVLFHPYDRWDFAEMGAAADDRYTTYVVRRLSAYPNLWWSMANEYDLMYAKTEQDWERLAALVVADDPARHLLSIHNFRPLYDHSRPWITHASVQATDPYTATVQVDAWRKEWGKPVVVDECGYEGNLESGWGNLSGRELTRRFWEAAVRGGYAGHGETYHRDDDQIWWAKGGELTGDSPARIAFLRRITQEAPGGILEPLPHTLDIPQAGVGDDYLLHYFGFFRPSFRNITLPPDRHYRIDVIDTWNMTVDALPGTHTGTVRVELPGREYMALRITAVR